MRVNNVDLLVANKLRQSTSATIVKTELPSKDLDGDALLAEFLPQAPAGVLTGKNNSVLLLESLGEFARQDFCPAHVHHMHDVANRWFRASDVAINHRCA